MNNSTSLLEYMSGEVWAMDAKQLSAFAGLARMESTRDLSDALEKSREHHEVQAAARVKAVEQVAPRAGAIAVIPIFGGISKRDSYFSRAFGGASVEVITQQFRQALADESVTSICLLIDSPGGSVQGIEEVSAEIYAARKAKPIVAYADGMAASAAFWIASAAHEVVATPSADIGSVGVYGLHMSVSRALDMAGIDITFIKSGKYKTEGNPYEILSEEALAAFQSRVDEHYNTFTGALARHRGTTTGAVKAGFGEGRTMSAKASLAAGMIDRIEPIDALIKRMSSRSFAAGQGNRALANELVTAAMLNADLPDEAESVVTGDPVAAVEAPPSQLELERRRRRLRLVGV